MGIAGLLNHPQFICSATHHTRTANGSRTLSFALIIGRIDSSFKSRNRHSQPAQGTILAHVHWTHASTRPNILLYTDSGPVITPYRWPRIRPQLCHRATSR
ncbi:hypothetical protein LX32DRAFT_127800 [Colletotrichum zoysiae]|uniref:Uncharacterized protein n=1 Tax=Colletotrichum zoysiae TaxID=1216348 RepID=A0AAD9LZK3_9PEZI|nr:hypothetical protein LX32DRAFT_127800 [Colletotrichum zoysiae]